MFFNLFVHQTTSTDPFSALISPHVLHAAHSYLAQICTFLTPINLIKSAPVCCELIELLRFYRFRALISIGCNVKLMARFHQDALPRFPWLVFIYVGINDLRMRMYLQHRRWLSFACYRRKTIYLWNVWRPILHVLFYWPLPYFAGLLVWIRATNVPNFSQIGRQISEILRVKILDIPHQLWTAYLSQMRPSPIGMKPVPDERPGAMSHWGNWTKILRDSFSRSGRWKLIFTNVWPLITY